MRKIIGGVSLVLFCLMVALSPIISIVFLLVFIWSIQSKIQLSLNHFYRKYIILGTIFGLFTEVLAILDNLDAPPEEKILFHPDPGIDLLLGAGFYFWVAVVWALLFKRYTFTPRSIFVVGGIWGVVVEQNMAILLSPFTYGIAGFFFYGYVFLIYGSFMAIPPLFFGESLEAADRKKRTLKHAVLAFAMLCGAYVLAGAYMAVLMTALGVA